MRQKETEREIAGKRILKLFLEARRVFSEDSKLADRYVQLARKLSMKYKAKIPRNLKRSFCRHCNCYLVPSKNCRIRIHKSRVIYYCLNCKKFMRFVLK